MAGAQPITDTLPQTVLQFGTGKFLRAFVDVFVHQANQAPPPAGLVAVVQSTGTARAAAFNTQQGRYGVAVRGLQEGRRIDERIEVRSVGRAFAAQAEWNEVLGAACAPPLRAIVSNVTEAGFALEEGDSPQDVPPRSFPAKLLAVLKGRFEAGQPGVAILPCELLDRNAERLLELVLRQAARWGLSGGLVDWLRSACQWRNTLVDRIVSSPAADDPIAQDPLAAVAEPFALWLIEGQEELPILAGHPAVRRVDRLESYYLRKVRILNGAHTALVAKARPLGFATVREAALDPAVGDWLRRVLFEEIVPVLEGRSEQPARFAEQVLERFANPFLEHRLADIALHHAVKLQSRIVPTHEEYRRKFGRAPRLLSEVLGAG